jgi:hypothetical protein
VGLVRYHDAINQTAETQSSFSFYVNKQSFFYFFIIPQTSRVTLFQLTTLGTSRRGSHCVQASPLPVRCHVACRTVYESMSYFVCYTNWIHFLQEVSRKFGRKFPMCLFQNGQKIHQQKSDVQWTTCLLGAKRGCQPKERISAPSSNTAIKNVTLTVIHRSKTHEPRLTANWNSWDRWTTCCHAKLSD